jgi:branched-chain amino acid transport system substrate-binding protein
MDNAGEASRLHRGWRRRAVAIAAAGALLLAACGDDDDSADTGTDETTDDTGAAGADDLLGPEELAEGEPVKIGMVSDGSTDAFDNTDELRSAEATAEYWNTHHGGVGGRPIEVVTCESKNDPAAATDCGNQLVEADVVAVALSQSGVAEQLWEPLHQAGIPTFWFQTSGDEMLEADDTSFAMVNPLATFFGVPLGVVEESGADKLAFMNIDVPVALTNFESGAVDTIVDNAGLEYELIKIPVGTADMTTQAQQVVSSGAGVVHIIGNDAFCIAALQGLEAVGYEGEVTSIAQCFTDVTREQLAGEQLEGVKITSTVALGDESDEAYQRYQAVMGTYGQDVEDVDNFLGFGAYTIMASLAASLDGIEGEITPETVAETIKSMDETDFPGAAGMTFQCGGSAFPEQPAVCTNQSLAAELDADGQPSAYEVVDPSDILP